MFANRFNWLAFPRAAWVMANPLQFFLAIARKTAPAQIAVRTPTGRITVALRNFESLKTLFSIFCRQDYLTRSDGGKLFVDVGANVGLAALYFLSRHPRNRVICFEPDVANLDFLKRNLAPFTDRARIVECAVGVRRETTLLYRSEDGKYSSLIPSELAVTPQEATVESFDEILRSAGAGGMPLVVKLDVEGMEVELIKSIRFETHRSVERLICESVDCARHISRPHSRVVRGGYVEDLCFTG